MNILAHAIAGNQTAPIAPERPASVPLARELNDIITAQKDVPPRRESWRARRNLPDPSEPPVEAAPPEVDGLGPASEPEQSEPPVDGAEIDPDDGLGEPASALSPAVEDGVTEDAAIAAVEEVEPDAAITGEQPVEITGEIVEPDEAAEVPPAPAVDEATTETASSFGFTVTTTRR